MNDQLIQCIWLIHQVSTLYMFGLIWFVQIVHYPLLGMVGGSEFQAYEREHVKRTTWVVSPMIVEFGTGLLLIWIRPAGVPAWAVWSGLCLLSMIWLSTMLIQVPCHQRLEHRFDAKVHRVLVRSNWIRTICWTLRAVLVFWIVFVTSFPIPMSAQESAAPIAAPGAFDWGQQ